MHITRCFELKKSLQLSAAVLAMLLVVTVLLGLNTLSSYADENEVNPQQLPDSSFIYDTSITELSEADAIHQEQTVQVVGEVVGDSIQEAWPDKYRWITLAAREDTSNATIEVYMSEHNVEKIDTFGKYGQVGTILQVRGTFHLSCPTHEGVTDLHADFVTVVEKGKEASEEVDASTFALGGMVVVVGVVLVLVYHRVRESMR